MPGPRAIESGHDVILCDTCALPADVGLPPWRGSWELMEPVGIWRNNYHIYASCCQATVEEKDRRTLYAIIGNTIVTASQDGVRWNGSTLGLSIAPARRLMPLGVASGFLRLLLRH